MKPITSIGQRQRAIVRHFPTPPRPTGARVPQTPCLGGGREAGRGGSRPGAKSGATTSGGRVGIVASWPEVGPCETWPPMEGPIGQVRVETAPESTARGNEASFQLK